jgi:hypothetical protein
MQVPKAFANRAGVLAVPSAVFLPFLYTNVGSCCHMMTSLLEVKDRAELRSWLKEHGTRSTEVWLVSHKKDSGKARVAHGDAVEESALFRLD